VPPAYDEEPLWHRPRVLIQQHFLLHAVRGSHGCRRNGHDSGYRDLGANAQSDSSAQGVTGQDGSIGVGQAARHQTGDKGLGAIFGALRRKGAGAVAMSW
jgi:uncharacterized protein YidB (DUF937 family)